MKNIMAFAGSNSKTSINKQLAKYAASLVENAEVTTLDEFIQELNSHRNRVARYFEKAFSLDADGRLQLDINALDWQPDPTLFPK